MSANDKMKIILRVKFIMARLLVLVSILVYGSSAKSSKRILLTDSDFADDQQMQKDIQNLKSLVQQLQETIKNLATTGTG